MDSDLEDLRQEIQRIDLELVRLLAYRNEKIKKVALIKSKNNLSIVNENVFKIKMIEITSLAKHHGLSSSFVRKIWRVIHHNSIKVQKNLISDVSTNNQNLTSKN